MPDWEALVDGRLAGLSLDPAERAEVIAEVAAHLEETWGELRRRGMTEEKAVQRTLSEVEDWRDLCRKVETAKARGNIMNNRVRQLWLPGLLTFVLSTGILALIQIYGPKPVVVRWRNISVPWSTVYIPWLLLLPLVGAIGAFLSHRAGGSRHAVLSSIVFPVLPFLGSIVVVLPFSLVFDHFIAHNPAPTSLFMALFGWVLAPGVALLAGGLLAQFLLSRRSEPRRIVSG